MTAVAPRPSGLALLADLETAGAISATGLYLSEPPPFPQFEALCALLGRIHEMARFAIGDAIMLGEKMYGEEAFQAFEAFNLSEEARREYLRVSLAVPRSRRRKESWVSWSHHRAVAALEPAEQKKWLKVVADQRISHAALRDALRAPSEDVEREVCPSCGRPM